MRDIPVEYADREIAGWNQGHQSGYYDHQQAWMRPQSVSNDYHQDQQGQQGQCAEISDGGVSLDRTPRFFLEARAVRNFRFKSRHAFGDQKVPNVCMRNVFAGVTCRFGHAQRGASDFRLTLFRPFADAFDDVPVAIARGKIHPRINARRILRQLRIDPAHGFEKIFPVQVREQAHAGDDVADGDLRGGLALVLFLHDLFDREPFFGELLLEPLHYRHHCRVLFTQALRELDDERAAERFAPGHAGSEQRQQLVGLTLGLFEELVGESVRFVTLGA